MKEDQVKNELVECCVDLQDIALTAIARLNAEIDQLHDECNKRAKEQEDVEHILGKALGFTEDDGVVDILDQTAKSLADQVVAELDGANKWSEYVWTTNQDLRRSLSESRSFEVRAIFGAVIMSVLVTAANLAIMWSYLK